MKITNALKIALKSLLSLKMGEVVTDKAVLVFDGDELAEGMEVYILNEEGDAVPAADGEYTTEDKKVIKVVEGKVAEIVDPDAEVDGNIEREQQPNETNEEPAEVSEIAAEEVNEEVAPADEPEPDPTEEATEEGRLATLEGRLAEFTEGLNQIINSIAGLEDRIAELEAKLAKVEAPAAEPIDEAPEVQESGRKSRLSYLRND